MLIWKNCRITSQQTTARKWSTFDRSEPLWAVSCLLVTPRETLEVPELTDKAFQGKGLVPGSDGAAGSTTGALGNILRGLVRHKGVGKRIVPIIPDEARTFGMEDLFSMCGIYSSKGQLYEPVDAGKSIYYKEAKNGQLLEEGINEAGTMSSFIAARCCVCQSRHEHGAILCLLFYVRLPASWRPHLVRGGYALQGLSLWRHFDEQH